MHSLQVQRGASLLVHDADLQRVARESQHAFDRGEQVAGQRDFLRAVHLRLHDIDAAGARIARAARASQVVHRGQCRDHAVEYAFRDLRTALVEHRVGGHQVADVAHQQQRASLQRQRRAVGRGVFAVGVHGAQERAPALLEALDEVALHQPQPVAVDLDLVPGIHRGHRVLAVLDRGQRRFEQQVLDARGIVLADRVRAVDLDLDVQPVVAQQHGIGRLGPAAVAGELRRRAQPHLRGAERDQELAALHRVAGGVLVAAGGERCRTVQERAREGDHARPAHRVVGAGAGGPAVLGDRIGAVERVVEAAPARIRGVQRVARVHHRHHQLRPGERGDLGIDVLRADREVIALGQQVADPGQEGAIGSCIESGVRAVPGVDLRLQLVAARQHGAVARGEFPHDGGETAPEGLGVDTGAGQDLLDHELVQGPGDLQAVPVGACVHLWGSSGAVSRRGRRRILGPRSRRGRVMRMIPGIHAMNARLKPLHRRRARARPRRSGAASTGGRGCAAAAGSRPFSARTAGSRRAAA